MSTNKSATRTLAGQLEDQDRVFMRRIQSWNYNDRNRVERNPKKCVHMAAYRATDKTIPPEVLAARMEACREASRRYREKNAWKLQAQRRQAQGTARAAVAAADPTLDT
ncbi:hypothetical protein C8J57DRAFT_1528765 [Mycena rebaudengoi]|nr:hypothetical protein C8J57DRAFT_1528765 [Mycena rebaudengoi]